MSSFRRMERPQQDSGVPTLAPRLDLVPFIENQGIRGIICLQSVLSCSVVGVVVSLLPVIYRILLFGDVVDDGSNGEPRGKIPEPNFCVGLRCTVLVLIGGGVKEAAYVVLLIHIMPRLTESMTFEFRRWVDEGDTSAEISSRILCSIRESVVDVINKIINCPSNIVVERLRFSREGVVVELRRYGCRTNRSPGWSWKGPYSP